MASPENNENNRLELASRIASGWSRTELEDYVAAQMALDYKDDEQEFKGSWDDFKDSFIWSRALCESVKKECPNPGCHCGACEKE